MATLQLSKKTFIETIANYEVNPQEWKYLGKQPALIDFYASWCGPCKGLAPILEELSEEYEGRINVYKIDIDEEPELASIFNIRSVPTLLFVPLEGLPQISQGALPKNILKDAINKVLLV